MSILSNLLPKPKAKRATVEFCPGVTVDGYRLLKTDEFRVGVQGASLALGYSQQWLYQLLTRGGKTAEALSDWGFSNFSEDVEIVNMGEGRGRNWATTISLTDFNCLINYAAVDGRKSQARGLLRGLSAVALEVFFRDAFGIQIDQSVIYPFYKEYAKGLCWTEEDRQDIQNSCLPGDTTSFDVDTLKDYFGR
jgi:hypothetical protein